MNILASIRRIFKSKEATTDGVAESEIGHTESPATELNTRRQPDRSAEKAARRATREEKAARKAQARAAFKAAAKIKAAEERRGAAQEELSAPIPKASQGAAPGKRVEPPQSARPAREVAGRTAVASDGAHNNAQLTYRFGTQADARAFSVEEAELFLGPQGLISFPDSQHVMVSHPGINVAEHTGMWDQVAAKHGGVRLEPSRAAVPVWAPTGAISRIDYNPNNWSRCRNDDFGFAFYYPRGWIQIPHPSDMLLRPPSASSFLSRERGNVTQVFSPALTLMLKPREGGPSEHLTQAYFLEHFADDMHNYFSDFHEHSRRRLALLSGQPAIVVSFSLSNDGRSMRAMTLVAATSKDVFIFDGSALATEWSMWGNTLENCLLSLNSSEH